MTTRYKTEGEKSGVKRRASAYRQRLREAGRKPREIWASDAENDRIKSLLAYWRGEPTDLDQGEIEAAAVLRPTPGDETGACP